MLRHFVVITLAVFSLAIATQVLAREKPTATMELVAISPAPDSAPLTGDVVIEASIRYSIDLEKLKRKRYFISIVFASTEGIGYLFNEERTRLGTDRVYLKAPSETVVLKYPMDAVWNDIRLDRPVIVQFVLLETTGSGKSRSLAISDPMVYE